MGKSRGRGRYRGGGRGGKGRGDDEDSEEEYEPVRGGQNANVGMLPPSDSEEESEEGAPKKPAEKAEKAEKPAKAEGQSKTAGKLPASGSEDEDEDEEESSSEDEAPLPEYLAQPSQPRKKKQQETPERSPEEIRKDLERLELIRKKREEDRLKRIKEEGWDRFQPVSDTNRPPGHVPSDHPSQKKD